MRQFFVTITATVLLLFVVPAIGATDEELYGRACAACHGVDGRGRSQEEIAFETPLPDFSDCEFASREPDPDWFAVIHEGGPVRAFDRMMPAFGDALTADEINQILAHVRTFCSDNRWPRGEFNLPRPLFTEKAFPEDETVVTASYDTGDSKAYEIEFLYEKRFGPVGMIEVAMPLASVDSIAGGRNSGIGDISIGYKHALHHNLASGNIVSAGFEVIEGNVRFLGFHVIPDSVPLRERSPGAVLAAQPHRGSLEEKRAEGEKLRCGPVDLASLLYGLEDLGEPAGDLWVQVESFRDRRERLGDTDPRHRNHRRERRLRDRWPGGCPLAAGGVALR